MNVCIRYGLSGSVWSGDEDRAAEMANQLQAGQIFTNSHGGRLDVPFGGFKQSGIGRVFGQVGVPYACTAPWPSCVGMMMERWCY